MTAYDFLSETLIGKQGPKGDVGPQGEPGGGGAEFVFDVPDPVWIVEHSLEFKPSVTVLDATGIVVQANVAYSATLPRIVVSHAQPSTGSVILS